MEKIQGIFGEIRYEDRGGLGGVSYMDLTSDVKYRWYRYQYRYLGIKRGIDT